MTNFIHVNQSNSFIQPQSMYDFNFTENYCLIEQHLSIYSLFSPGDARYFNLNQISILDKNFYIFIFSNEATTMVS